MRPLGAIGPWVLALACSHDIVPETLPGGVGMLVLESSATLAGIESWDAASHAYAAVESADVLAGATLSTARDGLGAQRLFVVDRASDLVVEVESTGRALGRYPVGDAGDAAGAAEPHDVAVASDGALWITRYRKPTLWFVSPKTGLSGTVDLSSFASPPQMDGITIVGSTAYVLLRGLDPMSGRPRRGAGQIVAIDTDAKTARRWFAFDASTGLDGCNGPIGTRTSGAGAVELVVTCADDPSQAGPDSRAGVARLALSATAGAGPTLTVALPALRAGGVPIAVQLASDDVGYALVQSISASGAPVRSLESFSPSGVVAPSTLLIGADASFAALVLLSASDDPLIAIADASASAPAIRFVSQVDGASVGALTAQLPPVGLAVLNPTD
jgi:hypothetical protein